MAIRLRPRIRKFAESMEINARENGLHGDTDQSYLYARAKDGLNVIADNILSDADGLPNSCANMANIMMLLGCPLGADGVGEVNDE